MSTRVPGRESIHTLVKEKYGELARGASGSSCCGARSQPARDARTAAERIGYSKFELDSVPEGANLGLGCGNPTAVARLRPGEIVLDLGAGAGFDALLAARAVGPTGRVIGVDMTPEMLEKARGNAARLGIADRVEFREGVIEALPVATESVDAVISNCVINLSSDKGQVFREAFRVLKPGGRMSVSDIVLTEPLPPAIASQAAAWVGCIAGAMLEEDYLAAIAAAGFVDVKASRTSAAPLLADYTQDPIVRAAIAALGGEVVERAAASISSLRVEARRPAVAET